MINSALVTDASKAAARQTLVDYSTGVFAHITGDWAQHNQAVVYATTPFLDQGGNTDTISTLRLGLTNVAGVPFDTAIAIPCNATGTNVLVNSPPIITVQPADMATPLGSTTQFVVVAVSSIPETFQWNFNGTAIPNQTVTQLVLSNTTGTNQGYYSVVVSNANGSVTSRSAHLTTVAAAVGGPAGSSGPNLLVDIITGDFFNFF